MSEPGNTPLNDTADLRGRLLAVRREVLVAALKVQPSSPVPEAVRRHSAIYLRRFYDAFADFIVDGQLAVFKTRRDPLRRAMLTRGLPSAVAIEMDKVIAAELVAWLPDYAATIQDRLVRSQISLVETNIQRLVDRDLAGKRGGRSHTPAAPS